MRQARQACTAAIATAALVAGSCATAATQNPHPIHPLISWTAVRHVLHSGPGCSATYRYTVRITGSTEYLNEHIQTYTGSHYAGKRAVVELYGPDYPSHPRETRIVGADGTFTVDYDAHTCAKPGSAGVAMVSVGRFQRMVPPAP
jgi:hypothetical protein